MLRVRTSLLALAAPLVAAASLLAIPAVSGAAPVQEQWTAEAERCGGAVVNGQQVGSERGSGQMDAAGNLYLPCSSNEATGAHDNYIAVFNAAGVRTGRISLDFTPDDGQGYTDRASDVAPSPDGSFLYVIKYADYTAYRFVRQANGTYRAQSKAEWALATYPFAGGGAATNRPLGQFLATDANGDIYFSSGLWAENAGGTDDAIVKYRPDGSYVTRFGRRAVAGEHARTLGLSKGSFGGVAVTANGARVFVTDINNSRIQRFARQGDGSYRADLEMGPRTDDEMGCYGEHYLAAPYDVALSARGEVLVINTTCYNVGTYPTRPYATIEVKGFSQDGVVRHSIISVSKGEHRVHGMAVDRVGGIHLPQARAVLRPSAGWSDAGLDAGGGGPLGGTAAIDGTAPVITALSVNPTTTTGTAVTLAIGATDASGVTHLRIREDGVQGGWIAFTGSVPHTITERLGAHELVVEVRDAAGNVAAASVTVTRVAPAPAPQPTPTQPIPTQPTPTQPAPTQPKPTQPAPTTPKPAAPAQPANPGGTGTVQGGGGVAAERPTITKLSIPVQLFRGTRITVRIAAAGTGGVSHVRFSTAGTRWSAWRPLTAASLVNLPKGPGWKGVFVQVRDAAGTPSVPYFQPVLVGPRGIGWYKGTRGADRAKLGRGTQHVDLSSFDDKVDRVSCGAGFDTVYAQPEDIVAKDCERVTRITVPAWS